MTGLGVASPDYATQTYNVNYLLDTRLAVIELKKDGVKPAVTISD
jgi:hypothetical protein